MSKKQKKSKMGFGAGLVGGAAICLALFGGGLGFGTGGSGAIGVGNEIEAEKAAETEAVQETAETTAEVETQEETTEAEVSRKIIEVSVVENNYFYDNKKLELEELLSELDVIEEAFVVEVSEDQGSLKAYRTLLEELEQCGYSYAEVGE